MLARQRSVETGLGLSANGRGAPEPIQCSSRRVSQLPTPALQGSVRSDQVWWRRRFHYPIIPFPSPTREGQVFPLKEGAPSLAVVWLGVCQPDDFRCAAVPRVRLGGAVGWNLSVRTRHPVTAIEFRDRATGELAFCEAWSVRHRGRRKARGPDSGPLQDSHLIDETDQGEDPSQVRTHATRGACS